MASPQYTNANLLHYLAEPPLVDRVEAATTRYVPKPGDPDYRGPDYQDPVAQAKATLASIDASPLGQENAAVDAQPDAPSHAAPRNALDAFLQEHSTAGQALSIAGTAIPLAMAGAEIPGVAGAIRSVVTSPTVGGAVLGGYHGARTGGLSGMLEGAATGAIEGYAGGKVFGALGRLGALRKAADVLPEVAPAAEAIADDTPNAIVNYGKANGETLDPEDLVSDSSAIRNYGKAAGQRVRQPLVNAAGNVVKPGPQVGTMSPSATPADMAGLRAKYNPTTLDALKQAAGSPTYDPTTELNQGAIEHGYQQNNPIFRHIEQGGKFGYDRTNPLPPSDPRWAELLQKLGGQGQ